MNSLIKNKQFIIDLTDEIKLESHIKIKLKKICNENINEFSNLIGLISSKLSTNLDWWVSSPANRNTLTSNLYLKFCQVKLIIEMNKINKIDLIIVDSNNFKSVLKQILHHDKIIVKNKSSFIFYYFSLFKFVFFQIIRRFLQIFACRISNKNKNKNIYKNITLIDSYVLPGFYSKDRYYNGLWEILNPEERKSIYFLPSITYTKIRKGLNLIGNIYQVYIELRSSKRPFLIKEDYLYLHDIIYSIFFCLRINFLKFDKINYKGLNLSPLLKDDLCNINNFTLSIEGLLNYRFIKNLFSKSIKLNKFIDWWENQPVDKGYHLGLKKFYPNVKAVGYLGYVPRNFELQLLPTKYEKNYGVIPEKIAVIGQSVINLVNKLNPDQKVFVAPAFRYNYLWTSQNYSKDNKLFNLLIALPINYEDSIIMLKKIFKIDFLNDKNIKIFIKPHPTMSEDLLNKKIQSFILDNVSFTNEKTEVILKKSNLVISSMSIISLESISLGIPAIVIQRETILDFNPIPEDINNVLWKKCKSTNDITKYIIYFKKINLINPNKFNEISFKIKKDYFSQINRSDTLKLLDINNA